jgi:hypothetical protein
MSVEDFAGGDSAESTDGTRHHIVRQSKLTSLGLSLSYIGTNTLMVDPILITLSNPNYFQKIPLNPVIMPIKFQYEF